MTPTSNMVPDYSKLITECKERQYFYSPYRFIKGYNKDEIFTSTVIYPLLDKIKSGNVKIKQINIDKERHYVVIEPLLWDTKHFGFPVYKILAVLYGHDTYRILKEAMLKFMAEISNQLHSYYFLDLPSEDTKLIQAVCECGFKLTETRLHYVLSKFDSNCHKRHPVRIATEDDIDNLKLVAINMRNPYDRLHADISFDQKTADRYLTTYIENSVRGFADLVLVPAAGNGPPDGFITSSIIPEKILGKRVAKIGALAISDMTRKGWGIKIGTETIYNLKEKDVDYIMMNTQASNRATIRIVNSLGFSLVFVTHIFSKSIMSA